MKTKGRYRATSWENRPSEGVQKEVLDEITALLKEKNSLQHKCDTTLSEKEGEKRKIFLDIISVLDDFDKLFGALASKSGSLSEPEIKLIKSFQARYNRILSLLEKYGVTRIKAGLGEIADAKLHKIIDTVEDKGKANGIIVEELCSGYFWPNGILRETDVIVVKNPRK